MWLCIKSFLSVNQSGGAPLIQCPSGQNIFVVDVVLSDAVSTHCAPDKALKDIADTCHGKETCHLNSLGDVISGCHIEHVDVNLHFGCKGILKMKIKYGISTFP